MATKTGTFILILSFLGTACGGGGGGGGGSLEIVGSYTDDYGSTHEITADTWTMGGVGVFEIETWDNAERWLVAHNHVDNEFDPDKWSRMDWTFDGDDLYFCQVAFDAESAEQAQAATPADPDDLAMGCGGTFPWSKLSPG
jgi:hypothetical protein